MKTATQAYKSQMNKLLRNRSYVGVAFGNIDVSAGTDGDWDGDALSWSSTTYVDYEHDYAYNEVTLELNRWALDGSQEILNTDHDYGWVGDEMSAASGNISYVMTRNFGVSHALAGITLAFDTNTNEFPTAVNVEFINEDSTSVDEDVTPTESKVEVTLTGEAVRSVVLTFSDMMPYRRPRVQATLWGIGYFYTNADLISCSQANDVDPLARRLPQEKFSFTIHDYKHTFDPDNPQGVYATINKGAPIVASYGYELDDGTVEWLKGDRYVLNNKPTFQNSKVAFQGTGLLSTLTGTYYKGVLGKIDFYSLAEAVLRDANLTPSVSGGDPWVIDSSLANMYTTAPLPIATHAECLQMIAHACNCRLFTDDDNIIHIEPFGVTPEGIFSGEWAEGDDELWISSWENVDFGTESDDTYVTLEWNRWILGTNQVIGDPDNVLPKGHVDSYISDSTGSGSSYTKVKHFDIPHDLPTLIITFDNVLGEYPHYIDVRCYSSTGATIYNGRNINVTSSTITINTACEDCEWIWITSTSTWTPHRRLRITKVAYLETDFSLTLDLVKQDTLSTTRLDRLRNVYVSQYSYTASQDSTKSKLYEVTTDETEIHAEFSMATDITVTVTGGSVTASSLYAQAADLTLSSGTKTVLIEGISVNEGSVVYTYNFNSSGEDDIEENKLITNKDMADAHAAHIGAYLSPRNTYEASYRGNPEVETGDLISVETAYGNAAYGLVLVDRIDFNGALSGNLTIKGLVE